MAYKQVTWHDILHDPGVKGSGVAEEIVLNVIRKEGGRHMAEEAFNLKVSPKDKYRHKEESHPES